MNFRNLMTRGSSTLLKNPAFTGGDSSTQVEKSAFLFTRSPRLYRQGLHSLVLFKKLANKVRRMILCATAQDYLKEQEKLRSGECYQCGKCCKLLFKCPFLGGSEDNPRCTIYHDRPKPCMAFPIDERDLADVNFQCGYFFQEKPKTQFIIPSFS